MAGMGAGRVKERPTLPVHVAIAGITVARRNGVWYTHHSFGRIVELLAARVAGVVYHAPESPGASANSADYALDHPRISVVPWFPRRNTLQALRRPLRLLRDYWGLTGRGDVIFLRSTPAFIWAGHFFARLRGRRAVQWAVGNPVAILRAERRHYGSLLEKLGLGFAVFEQNMMKLAVRTCGSYVLANGVEIARIFGSRRTLEVVSSSISEDDLRPRADTCGGDVVRVLFVGFIRPEKGIEYLIRALPRVRSAKPVELVLAGGAEQFSAEKARLARLADELGVSETLTWVGYVRFGEELFSQIDKADMLVLPSLSEGTPRVLVEARARGVPVVSTNVGGIPSSVTHERDGLLVPARDAEALAAQMSRLINDDDLRRDLIRRGFERASVLTVEHFVDRVVEVLAAALGREAELQPGEATRSTAS